MSKQKQETQSNSIQIKTEDLAQLLVRKNVISQDEYEGLEIKAFMIPKLDSANESNWMQIRDELRDFLRKRIKTPGPTTS